MINSIKYGIASLEDLPRVVELKIAMFEESKHRQLLHPDAVNIILEDYRRLYTENEACHFIAHVSDRIVALAGAFLKSDIPFRYFNCEKYGFIGDVYTEPHFRKRGIATHLNQDALSWLKAKSVKMVRLLATNAGYSIYSKLGFKPSDAMVLNMEDRDE
jgi:GNAT superfamily N-acetyltransferase